ncbi:MAG: MFS transporter [Planctomycetes bacterium]|nr:MFS transporter [Planctomycetota bacterium]
MRDRRVLYLTAFLRALATGLAGVLLGLYLPRLGFSMAEIGFTVAAGLAAGAAAALLVTLLGDRLGRRRALILLAALGALGSLGAAAASGTVGVTAAVFFGMLNGMGRDRGASLVLEQAILPATAGEEERTRAFAWYNLFQDAGHALGGLLAGLPDLFHRWGGASEVLSHRLGLGGYAALMLASLFLYSRLSPSVEARDARARARISPGTRRVVFKISSLFALDSLGGGFLTTSLLSYFFFERFGVSGMAIGVLFFAARLANALSHLGAAWLAGRIGLVNTMVFTHIPSSLLLVTVAIAPSFEVAALLFLLREGLVEMDVPTRQSYVMAVVRPEERTFASGATHLVRLGAWAVAPSFAGLFMQSVSLVAPLLVGAGLKIAYDGLLYFAFRGVKPPEEKNIRGGELS